MTLINFGKENCIYFRNSFHRILLFLDDTPYFNTPPVSNHRISIHGVWEGLQR